VINPAARPKTQMTIARVSTVLMAIIITALAMLNLALIAQLVAIAFSMAGCTIFPLFLLGIWWSGSNRAGAKAGLIVGSLVTLISLTYLIGARVGWILPYNDFITYYLGAWYFAWIGAPLAIAANIIVSKLTKETPLEIRKFLIEQVHS
jgi:cation/acetate symporter